MYCTAEELRSMLNEDVLSALVGNSRLAEAEREEKILPLLEEAAADAMGDVEGRSVQRTKRMQRDLVFSVVIGDYGDDTCENIFLSFISRLDDGIAFGKNYMPIEIVEGSVDWVDEADSILLSKMAVKFDVKFSGGIYVDKVLSTSSNFNFTVEMEAIY